MLKSVLSAALIIALSAAPTLADTKSFGPFLINEDYPELAVLVGPIQQNAPLDFHRALRAFPNIGTIALHSNGGDVTAGLLLAQEVHDQGIATYVPPDRGCYSACAYVYFAGVQREVAGELGVHQMVSAQGSQYTVQVAVSDMLDTLAAFDVPPVVISEMLRTAPEEMRIYSAAEAQKLGLNRMVATASPAPPQRTAPAFSPDAAVLDLGLPPAGEADWPGQSNVRAYLSVAGAGSRQRGSVWWTQDTDVDGLSTVVAEASFPSQVKVMEVKITWRKNTDPELPTGVVIEFAFNFTGPGIADEIDFLPGMLAKAEFDQVGEPLVGASAKIGANAFIYALSAEDSASHQNSILLSERFFDFALKLQSGRNAILTVEKDDTAAALFRDVLESWVE